MKNKFKPNDRVRVRKNIKLDTTDPHMSFTMELMKRLRDNSEILVVKEVKEYVVRFYEGKDIEKGETRSTWSTLPGFLTKHNVDQNTYPDFEVKNANTM